MAASQTSLNDGFESYDVKHILLSNIPSEKTQKDIENYSFFLTNLYPNQVEITESLSGYTEWLLTYDSNLGLFE